MSQLFGTCAQLWLKGIARLDLPWNPNNVGLLQLPQDLQEQMAIVCDERDVVGIPVHQHEGDLIMLKFFVWVLESSCNISLFCCCDFIYLIYLEALRFIKLQKSLAVLNLRPEIMRRSSSMYCSLTGCFLVGFATGALQRIPLWCCWIPGSSGHP